MIVLAYEADKRGLTWVGETYTAVALCFLIPPISGIGGMRGRPLR